MAEYIEREALTLLAYKSGDYGHPAVVDLEDIADVPAADVVPVVHGRWEEADDGDGAVCSVCGEDFCNVYLEVERFKYCPNCGAHMKDGE